MHSPHNTARHLAQLADEILLQDKRRFAIAARVRFLVEASRVHALHRMDRLGRLIGRPDLDERIMALALDDYRYAVDVRKALLQRIEVDVDLQRAIAAQLGEATILAWRREARAVQTTTLAA